MEHEKEFKFCNECGHEAGVSVSQQITAIQAQSPVATKQIISLPLNTILTPDNNPLYLCLALCITSIATFFFNWVTILNRVTLSPPLNPIRAIQQLQMVSEVLKTITFIPTWNRGRAISAGFDEYIEIIFLPYILLFIGLCFLFVASYKLYMGRQSVIYKLKAFTWARVVAIITLIGILLFHFFLNLVGSIGGLRELWNRSVNVETPPYILLITSIVMIIASARGKKLAKAQLAEQKIQINTN